MTRSAPANPYLREFEQLEPEWRVPWMQRDPRQMVDRMLEAHKTREQLVRQYAWAVPSVEAIETIVRYSPIVEIGAGTGYWAMLIERAGGDIVAYDLWPPPHPDNSWHEEAETYFPVQQGSTYAAAWHPDRALFLCWPPYGEPMAATALYFYKGETVIYIGENGGCTADDRFDEALHEGFELVEEVGLPTWHGIHDYLSVWRRQRP